MMRKAIFALALLLAPATVMAQPPCDPVGRCLEAYGLRPMTHTGHHGVIVFRDNEDTLVMDFKKNGELDTGNLFDFCAGHRCVLSFCEQVSNQCPDLPTWPFVSVLEP